MTAAALWENAIHTLDFWLQTLSIIGVFYMSGV